MSKSKAKDKKNQNSGGLQAVIDQQKRQILEHTFTIRQLQDRLSRITQQHHTIVNTRDTMEKQYEETIDKQRIIIETHENNIKDLRQKIHDLEMKKLGLQSEVRELKSQFKQMQSTKNREMDDYKRITQNQITKLEGHLRQYNHFMNEKDQMEKNKIDLMKQIEKLRAQKTRQIADKQRQKVQATDKLRDQMLHQVSDMKTNLLSLKKEQLQTTTRLAILQNHQLTSQLEFQSKQTEKLLFENQQMQKKIHNLQKDLEVHKEVEQQLAKRSHYARGIIKKLTARIGQLQNELNLQKKPEKKDEVLDIQSQMGDKKNVEMLEALDRSLQVTQKKYSKLQSDFEVTVNQNSYLKSKLEEIEKKTKDACQLLLSYYQNVIKGDIQVKDQFYTYDLRAMRKRPLEQWSKQQIKMVVEILLNQLASKLNKKNLGIPNINKNTLLVLDEDQQALKLPKIFDSSIRKSSHEKRKMISQVPTNVATKIVAGNLRDWGRTVHTNSISHLSRKYKIYDK